MYAGFFVRFIAYAIDSMIATLIVGIVKLPFVFASSGGTGFLNGNFIFDHSVLDVFTYVGVTAYFVLLTYFSHSTLGKKLFRLQVVTQNGEWTLVNVLYRETIGRFLSSIMCIGYLAVLVTKQKQGFHDMLSDTFVIYANMVSASQEHPVAVAAGSKEAGIEETVVNPAAPIYDSKADVPKEEAPVYHSVSAFELSESHPIPAEAVREQEDILETDDHTDSDSMNL